MSTYISLLRGINVSGQKAIRKNELVDLYVSLGCERVATYLQSGNVIFDAQATDLAEFAARVRARIEQTFGYSVVVFVRDGAYFQSLVRGNPFINQRSADPAVLHVTFLYQTPSAEKLSALQVPAGETGEFAVRGDAVYLFCPDGYGKTRLSNTFFERKLAVPATTRNWNTVSALARLGAER